MKKVQRVIIFDPSMINRYGHFYVHTRSIADYSSLHGIDTEVVTNALNQHLAEEFHAHTILNFSGWDNQKYKDLTYAAHWTYANLRSDDGFKRFAQLDLRDDDLIIMHSASPNEFKSISNWYINLQVKPFLVACIHVSPHYYADRDDYDIATAILSRSLNDWRNIIHGGRVALAATNDDLTSYLAELGNLKAFTLPPIINIDDARKFDTSPVGRPINMFFSGYHIEKGIAVLVDALRINRFSDLEFTLQIGNPTAANQVNQLLGHLSYVKLLHGSSEKEDYEKLIGTSDVVLIPYDPSLYLRRSSGIFMEAMALGKPVIVTSNTVMSKDLIKLGMPGIIMNDFDPQSLILALNDMKAQFPIRKQIATSISSAYSAAIDIKAYMGKISEFLNVQI